MNGESRSQRTIRDNTGFAEGLKDNHAQSKDISLTDVREDDYIASKKTVCIHVDT